MEKAELPHHNALPPLHAETHNPEPHLPGTVEHRLGTNLQPDLTEEQAHPGVQCEDLPPHVHPLHPLPKLESTHTHQTAKQNPATPPASPAAPLEDGQ